MTENDYNHDNYNNYNHEGEQQAPEESAPQQSHEELKERWLEVARSAPKVEDLERLFSELEETKALLELQTVEYRLAVLRRARAYGKTEVAKDLGLSRKQIASWENNLKPEGEDLSSFYEDLRRAQEREARRAEKAAQKAAEEAAAVEAILNSVA